MKKVNFTDNLQKVDVVANIYPEAKSILRENTKFWLVKPSASLAGISGLDALVSGNYITLQPGDGDAKHEFIAHLFVGGRGLYFYRRSLAQETSDNKENEITVVPEVLESLKLKEAIIYPEMRWGHKSALLNPNYLGRVFVFLYRHKKQIYLCEFTDFCFSSTVFNINFDVKMRCGGNNDLFLFAPQKSTTHFSW